MQSALNLYSMPILNVHYYEIYRYSTSAVPYNFEIKRILHYFVLCRNPIFTLYIWQTLVLTEVWCVFAGANRNKRAL